MHKYKYVILGGGTTAGYAAKAFVDTGIQEGELAIISGESYPPIDRPPLSKSYLEGEEEKGTLSISDASFYDEHGIKLFLDNPAREIRFGKKSIKLQNGKQVAYDKLLIATGSKLRKLDVPGKKLKGLHYYRWRPQADQVKEAADQSKNVVIIGGSFVGSEVAAHLKSRGVENVAIVMRDRHLLSRVSTPEMGKYFNQYFINKGVRIFPDIEIKELVGEHEVNGVRLKGGEVLPAEMVIAGIGVTPNIQLFKKKNLKRKNGAIKVNKYGETNRKDVYAAGDVAIFPDAYFKGWRHVEHWQNAHDMGDHVARVMAGKRKPYRFLPFFFSDIFDLSYEYFGDHREATDYIIRGDMDQNTFSTWWFNNDRLVAVFLLGDRPPAERELAQKWLKKKAKPDKAKLQSGELFNKKMPEKA